MPSILPDGEDGCFVTWWCASNDNFGDIYIMHFLSDGSPDENWNREGLCLSDPDVCDGYSYRAISGANGSVILAWAHLDGNDESVRAQCISPNGNVLWNNGDPVTITGMSDNVFWEALECIPDGCNGAFFAWFQYGIDGGGDGDVYVQRIDAQGNVLWGDNGTPLAASEHFEQWHAITLASPGEAVVVWQYDEDGIASLNLYAMLIGGEEAMERLWDTEYGVLVTGGDGNQVLPCVVPDSSGGVYVVWCDDRDEDFHYDDVYAQHLNADGETLWQDNGIPVFNRHVGAG